MKEENVNACIWEERSRRYWQCACWEGREFREYVEREREKERYGGGG